MKYLVGETTGGTAVFAVMGQEAVNLTALDGTVGSDLMALIGDPALAESVTAKIDGATRVSVASITPALPVAAPGTIICVGLNYTDHIKEGGYELHQDYTFDQVNFQVDAIAFKGKNEPKQTKHQLDEAVHDMVSGIYALRGIAFDALIVGDTVSVPLFMDEEWFQLKAVYAGNEDIKWKGEKWNCALIHPVIQTGRIWKNPDDLAVYITNDANRIPLLAETRILFGSIKMELTNASGLRSPLGFVPN